MREMELLNTNVRSGGGRGDGEDGNNSNGESNADHNSTRRLPFAPVNSIGY